MAASTSIAFDLPLNFSYKNIVCEKYCDILFVIQYIHTRVDRFSFTVRTHTMIMLVPESEKTAAQFGQSPSLTIFFENDDELSVAPGSKCAR